MISRIVKQFIFLLVMLIGASNFAYDFPGLRLPNQTLIFLLPDAPGKPVALEFDKRDVNGYVGSDPVVLTVVAPSGKNVCEVLVPDDGDTKNKWQDGPRQRVKIAFTPEEPGVYVIRSNSSSSVDISYWFDKAAAVNTAWGVKVEKNKFMDGRVKLFLFLYVCSFSYFCFVLEYFQQAHLKVGNQIQQVFSLEGYKLFLFL